MSEPARDPVPHAARAVIDLFREALGDVRFPDVDRSMLDRATLDESERALLDAQCALEDAEGALERARAVVAEHTAGLAAKTQRALAYARVFAEGNPELREHLDAISVPTKRGELVPERSAASAPRRTRRGRKGAEDDGGTLFEAPVVEASDHAVHDAA